ncbi:hypothetical protein K438DRAFT_2027819 [Mycena galopus ATCC 62051]|nr:hypothetical protein K438DRAFT_2027819 [Mycena galopus ATCC 62051]
MGREDMDDVVSYHPYRRDNIKKVRRDEEEAHWNEAKEEGRRLLADSEARVDWLCERRAGVKGSNTASKSKRRKDSEDDDVAQLAAAVATASVRILARMDAHDLHARLCASQHAALFFISSSSVPPSVARTLHALQEVCFFTHTATFLHFQCVTQLSSAHVYAHSFPRTGTSTGYEAVRGRPCATSSSIITTRDHDAHQALHNPRSITTLRTKARPKPKRSTTTTMYDARFVLKHHRTIGPFSAAPLLTPARAINYDASRQVFRG